VSRGWRSGGFAAASPRLPPSG